MQQDPPETASRISAWVRSAAWVSYLCLGAVLIAIASTGPLRPVLAAIGAIGGAIAVAAGIALHRPRVYAACLAAAAGFVVYAAAFRGAGIGLPLVPHAARYSVEVIGTVTALTLIVVGYARLLRHRSGRHAWEGIIESSAIGVGIAQLASTAVVRWAGVQPSDAALLLPTGLGAVLAAVSFRRLRAAANPPSARIFHVGILAGLTAATLDAVGTGWSSRAAVVIGVGSIVSFGVAALHPSMVELAQGGSAARPTRSGAFVAVALLVMPLRLIAASQGGTGGSNALLIGDILLVILVAAYVVITTIQRGAATDQLTHMAYHDQLTGLPNRALLQCQITEAIERSAISGQTLAVIFCDLDRFKLVNDSLGHAVGDALLVLTAQRLRQAVDGRDMVARLGGDDFAIVCEGLRHQTDAEAIALRIAEVLAAPSQLDHHEVLSTVSMGIALVDPASDSAESALRNADAALYRAKERGRDRHEVFDDVMRDAAAQRLELGSAVRGAIERNEFELHHQPIVSLATGRVVGSEALLRWTHPTLGAVLPSTFVPIAEETGFAHDLGAWVIEQACRQISQRRWARADAGRRDDSNEHPRHVVSINVSPAQLRRVDFAPGLLTTMRRYGVAPAEITVEITETVLLEDTEYTRANLRILQRRGIRIAIDDFGTGYSALGYLKRFTVDVVKIDRSFVAGLGRDPEDEAIVRAIVGMSHALGLRCVAEGVEHAEQARWLTDLRCDFAQGYFYGRPAAWDALDERIIDAARLRSASMR